MNSKSLLTPSRMIFLAVYFSVLIWYVCAEPLSEEENNGDVDDKSMASPDLARMFRQLQCKLCYSASLHCVSHLRFSFYSDNGEEKKTE